MHRDRGCRRECESLRATKVRKVREVCPPGQVGSGLMDSRALLLLLAVVAFLVDAVLLWTATIEVADGLALACLALAAWALSSWAFGRWP